MKEQKDRNWGKTVIFLLLLVVFGRGMYCGFQSVRENVLQSNINSAIDIALMVKNNFQITDAEVSYMESLTFNEMEVDAINLRLMEVGDGVSLNCEVRNVYLLAFLPEDKIKYYADESNYEFFGCEKGTPLNGIWLLNGRINEEGHFEATQREDVYRYTPLSQQQAELINKQETYGEISEDSWGNFVTGYVPVYTVEGNYVGMLGIDIAPDRYQESAIDLAMLIIIGLLVAVLLLAGLFLGFYRKNMHMKERITLDKEEKYQRQLKAMSEVDEGNLIAKGTHNISQNITTFYLGKQEGALVVMEGQPYDDAVYRLAEIALKPEKAEEIRQKMGRKQLLKAFEDGETEGSIDYQRVILGDKEAWVTMKYALYEEPSSHDVFAFIYSYDVTDNIVGQEIVAQLGAMDYDALGLIDVRTHQYILRDIIKPLEGPTIIGEGDFDERAKERLPKILLPSEQETIIPLFQVDSIIQKLEEEKHYNIIYSVYNNQREIRRKRCRFCYLNGEKNVILYCRSDITDMYEKEQKQLRQIEDALDKAHRANDAKTEFFSRMSHDMRTPMNGILGLLRLSEEETDIRVLREDISKMKSAGEYLLGLINDSLDFQKIESGKMMLHPEIVHTGKLIENIRSMIQETANEKRIDFQLDVTNADLNHYIKVDPMRIKQIFVNLLSNAVKFTPQGGCVSVQIECTKRWDRMSRCQITIQDTGIGMSREFLEQGIFNPFSQESNEVTSSYAGSGLGLSIVRSLLELMGGGIYVESEKNVGTTFVVTMDYEGVDENEVIQAEKAGHDHHKSVENLLEGCSILIAEDHPLNAEIMMRLLEKEGCKTTWVKNGKECVEVYGASKEGQYDVILMDIRMPVMNGLVAAKQIYQLERPDAKTIPIIAVTANAYPEDMAHSIAVGMKEHLAKPIDPKILYETIARVLKK